MNQHDEFREIRLRVLEDNFRNPDIVSTRDMIEVGLSHFQAGNDAALDAQTRAVGVYRPRHLEEYLAGLEQGVNRVLEEYAADPALRTCPSCGHVNAAKGAAD